MTDDATHPEQTFDRRMLEALVCPLTQSRLVYDADRQELVSETAVILGEVQTGLSYPTATFSINAEVSNRQR